MTPECETLEVLDTPSSSAGPPPAPPPPPRGASVFSPPVHGRGRIGYSPYHKAIYPDAYSCLASLRRAAKKRAHKAGLLFELTMADMCDLLGACEGACALTRIPFDIHTRVGWRRPFAPSVDRISSHKGYTADNCRLVCIAVNIALSDWGAAVFERVVLAWAAQYER